MHRAAAVCIGAHTDQPEVLRALILRTDTVIEAEAPAPVDIPIRNWPKLTRPME